MVFFTCLQWNDIVSLALWCCDSSWFLKAYGILLKLSIGMDSVVWDGRSARTIGSLWRFTRWKVSSWVGAGGVYTQAQLMWRDKIEFSVGDNTPMTVGMW
ncbi:hypothetical protein YC2023_071225 [Brassica napus]